MQSHCSISTIWTHSSQYPREESNLTFDLRGVACRRHTPRTFTNQYPGQESNPERLVRTET